MTSSALETIVAVTTASIMRADALMLMIDERTSIFPYILGLAVYPHSE
jgi:hypothetical protein